MCTRVWSYKHEVTIRTCCWVMNHLFIMSDPFHGTNLSPPTLSPSKLLVNFISSFTSFSSTSSSSSSPPYLTVRCHGVRPSSNSFSRGLYCFPPYRPDDILIFVKSKHNMFGPNFDLYTKLRRSVRSFFPSSVCPSVRPSDRRSVHPFSLCNPLPSPCRIRMSALPSLLISPDSHPPTWEMMGVSHFPISRLWYSF